jgi:hypothetical protein
MYYDLGLKEWVFEIEQTSGSDISDRLMELVHDPGNAKRKIRTLQKEVRGLFKKGITAIS